MAWEPRVLLGMQDRKICFKWTESWFACLLMFIISWDIHTPKSLNLQDSGRIPNRNLSTGEGRKEEEYTLFSHDPSDH